MAFLVTPVPGNAARVSTTCCNRSTIIPSRNPVRTAAIVAEAERTHSCGS